MQLEPLSQQEIFNRVWQHFIIERQPRSVTSDGHCRYRGPEGAKCAVGLFIPDDCYSPWMEGLGADCILAEARNQKHVLPSELTELLSEHPALLRDLQNLHDKGTSRLEFERALVELADSYNLWVPK